jgi:hypothetical protein
MVFILFIEFAPFGQTLKRNLTRRREGAKRRGKDAEEADKAHRDESLFSASLL